MRFLKEMNKLPIIGLVIVVCITVATFLFSAIIPLHYDANEMGKNIGSAEGKAVGLVTGSFKGFTEGDSKGREDGLKSEDTAAMVSTRMSEVGNLEVLVAGVRLKNVHSVGDKYKALYLMAGDAVFTVDMKKAKVSTTSNGELLVVIPKPEIQLFIDERKTEKLAESQTSLFDGSAKDGYTAYMNSMTATTDEIQNTITNYDTLVKAAQESAVNQVSMLVKSVCGNDRAVQISIEA